MRHFVHLPVAALLIGALTCTEAVGFERLYQRHCAVCYGDKLEGAAQGPALVSIDLTYGDAVEGIANSIAAGMPDNGMPSWSETLSATEIQSLAIFIAEAVVVEQEMLIEDLARIRDIELDAQGNILLLLDHARGGQIVRMSPVESDG